MSRWRTHARFQGFRKGIQFHGSGFRDNNIRFISFRGSNFWGTGSRDIAASPGKAFRNILLRVDLFSLQENLEFCMMGAAALPRRFPKKEKMNFNPFKLSFFPPEARYYLLVGRSESIDE